MADDPNELAPDQSPGSIPPIDSSIDGGPTASWTIPPWLQQPDAPAFDPNAPPQIPDEFHLDTPTEGAAFDRQIAGVAPPTGVATPPTDQQLGAPWLAQQQADVVSHGPPTQADAVSGAPAPADALTPQQTQDRFAAIATDPRAPLDERSKAWASMTLDQRTNTLNSTDPKQLAALANDAMTPQEIATVAVRHNAAKLDEETTRLKQIYADNKAKADREATEQTAAYTYAQQENVKDAQAAAALVARAKNNPGERSIGRTIADAILAGIGGAMSQYTGGKNLALDAIQKRIEQNIQQQTEEISQGWKGIDLHRNAVATDYARHGDVIRAQGVARLAGLQEAKDALVTDIQNYDPQGTTALSRAQTIQQIGGAQQVAANALNQQHLENGWKKAKSDSEVAAQQEVARHNQAEEALARQKEAAAKAVKPDEVVHDPAWFAQQGYKTVPAVPMSVSSFTGVNASNAKTGEIAGKDTENAQKQSSGQVLDGQGNPYVKDGKSVQINPTVAEDLNKRIGGGQAYIDEMSIVKRMLAQDPSTFDRATWKNLNGHLETAAANWTQLYDAKASSRELDAAKEVIGADFSGYAARVKDKGTTIASIGGQIDSTKQALNTQLLRRAGIKGGADLIDTSEPPPTKETPADRADKVLTQNFGAADVDPANLDADDRAFVEAARKGITTDLAIRKDDYATAHDLSPIATRAVHLNIAPIQLKAFDDLEGDIKGRDEKARAVAVEHLDKIAKGSKSAAVQRYATGLIDEASDTTLHDSTTSLDNGTLDIEGGDPVGNRTVHEEAPKKK